MPADLADPADLTCSAASPSPALSDLLAAFDKLQQDICGYELALSIMEYDSQTVAPASGASEAGAAQAVLYAAKHELESSPATGELLAALKGRASELDPLHAAELRVFARTYDEESRLPAELVADYRKLVAEAFPAWRAAREDNDFTAFAPYLSRVFELLRTQANCLDPKADPYDVLLDRWQRGNSTAVCDRFFAEVSQTVVPLVRAIAEQPRRDYPFAREAVPASVQQDLAWDIARAIGLDCDRLTFGLTAHPCSYDLGRNDVRIAHHYYERNVLECAATTCHEGGHALYMQNVDPVYTGTCLHGGVEAGIHESQSRLMENNVGRSRPFMHALLPLLQKHIPAVYGGVSEDDLYAACNVVRPSLIRTQADELTYPLHIMVRYECEKRLVRGELAVSDVPALWHDLMLELLGVEVEDDAQGCLQDMHWASDFVGYFTGYALGNAYAAQFEHHARVAFAGDVDVAIAAGDLSPITGWLREHVWRHGKSLDPNDLVEQACGEPFDPSYYTRYLSGKFSALYGM